MNTEEVKIWDRPALEARVRGKPDRMARLINLFLSDMPPRLENLATNIASGDFNAVMESTHAIKGVASNLAVLRIEQYAASMEHEARNQQLEPLINLLPDLKASFTEAHSELNAFLNPAAR